MQSCCSYRTVSCDMIGQKQIQSEFCDHKIPLGLHKSIREAKRML